MHNNYITATKTQRKCLPGQLDSSELAESAGGVAVDLGVWYLNLNREPWPLPLTLCRGYWRGVLPRARAFKTIPSLLINFTTSLVAGTRHV